MIRRAKLMYVAVILAMGVGTWIGCGPKESAQNSAPSAEGEHHEHDGHQHAEAAGHSQVAQIDAGTPEAAMKTFFNAVCAGDATTAAAMLTTKAQTEMQNAEMHVLPPGSPNAQFTVGEVNFEPEHGGAFVASTWNDVIDGEEQTYQITWIMRQENNSWRIAGMSTPLFPNQGPSVLNFEDPADMYAQIQQAEAVREQQMASEGEILQATRPPNSTNPPPR